MMKITPVKDNYIIPKYNISETLKTFLKEPRSFVRLSSSYNINIVLSSLEYLRDCLKEDIDIT